VPNFIPIRFETTEPWTFFEQRHSQQQQEEEQDE